MSAGVSELSNAAVNLAAIREYSRKELTDVLDSVAGPKVLVIEPELTGPLGLVAEVALLKEHQVEKIYHLRDEPLAADCKTVVYLCRPRMKLMKVIANQVIANQDFSFSLFFVPRRTLVCQRVLEKEGVLDSITIGDYNLDIIPFDDDVLSMGLDNFRDCFLDGDDSSLFYVARALMKLQAMYGYFPNIKAKGQRAVSVVDMLKRMREESEGGAAVAPEIENLIIIDRDVDLVTPLLTQLTYEGLIDEFFGINNTYVELDLEILGREAPSDGRGPKKAKHPLNHNDRLFSEIRDMNFSVLGARLNKKAQYISANYEERHQAQTVSQLRDFMKKLNELQSQHHSLRVHTNVADRIGQQTNKEAFHKKLEVEQGLLRGLALDQDYVEECINKQQPLSKVLRILCLASLTNNGLKSKQFEFFRREILHTYGYQSLFTLYALERLGMLKQNDGRSQWGNMRKAMRLVVDDVDEENPNDVSYVYSGYAPLTARLVQMANKPGGWKASEEQLRSVPGPFVETTQRTTDPYSGADVQPAKRGVTLVFFIGGCTFTEMAAIRFLSQHEEGQREYIVATTKIISGDSLVQSVSQEVENRLRKIQT